MASLGGSGLMEMASIITRFWDNKESKTHCRNSNPRQKWTLLTIFRVSIWQQFQEIGWMSGRRCKRDHWSNTVVAPWSAKFRSAGEAPASEISHLKKPFLRPPHLFHSNKQTGNTWIWYCSKPSQITILFVNRASTSQTVGWECPPKPYKRARKNRFVTAIKN